MKYPIIIFFRNKEDSYIDNYILEFQNTFECTFYITSEKNDLMNILNSYYHLIVSYGNIKKNLIENIPKRCENVYIHFDRIHNIHEFNNIVNKRYICNTISKRIYTRPKFSVFTTTFNTFEKILRGYKSLLTQTYNDWEWIILDDSKDSKNFEYMIETVKDPRIRIYKRSCNSGSIGNVKNEAVSLCRGEILLEFDHDDELVNDLIEDSIKIFENNDVGFVYADFTNIYNDERNFKYEGTLCKGYGSYYMQKYKNKWVYVYMTPNINNITLSALTCCPNHPRMWKKNVLLNILENYSEYLPICDDFDLLLRTVLLTKTIKLQKMSYIQYVDNDGNNFSNIRNREINRIGPKYISPLFYKYYNVDDFMRRNNSFENDTSNDLYIWERHNEYQHKYINKRINLDYKHQYCILSLQSLHENINKIKELYKDEKNDFILIDNINDENVLIKELDIQGFDRFKHVSLLDKSRDNMIKYFDTLYKSCENTSFI